MRGPSRFLGLSSSSLTVVETLVYPDGDGQDIFYGQWTTPYGPAVVAHTREGAYCALYFWEGEGEEKRELQCRWPKSPLVKDQQRIETLAKDEGQKVRILLRGTPFQIDVWRELLNIPPGTLAHYGEIAQKINRPRAFRAVGTAVGQNPLAMLVPCHRVVHKSGRLDMATRYRWGKERKLAMIEDEKSFYLHSSPSAV